jgi:hypothetical protein
MMMLSPLLDVGTLLEESYRMVDRGCLWIRGIALWFFDSFGVFLMMLLGCFLEDSC